MRLATLVRLSSALSFAELVGDTGRLKCHDSEERNVNPTDIMTYVES
jgi:hypothetical protein